MAIDLSSLMPQQREIVTTLSGPLFVSAGAGSGKTFTLTRRILWALSPESGPFAESLDQVLAITFTKDAAAEIRERVRRALIEAGMDDAALSVDDAWISTIHGMCSRILRAHALELGLDPEFEIVEDTSTLMDQAVDHVLAAHPQGLDELLGWYSLTGEVDPATGRVRGTSARELVRRLLERASAARHGFDDIEMVEGAVDFSALMDAYQALAEVGSAKGAELARAAIDALTAFEGGKRTVADLTACMMACGIPRATKAFPKEQVAWLKAEAADAFVNAYIATGKQAMAQLLALARAVFDEYTHLKAERSALDNNDLLRLTYEALRDHADIRAAYAGRFRLVMIDEFQDTDQQQVDLINFLTGAGGRALCTVGDAQQSIYRFRGAEVEVFRRAQRGIEAGAREGGEGAGAGRVVKLVRNFRSHADILAYVARIFDDAQGGIMPGFLDLEPHEERRDGLRAAGASRRQAVLVAGGRTEQRTRAKAAAIARRFRALADAGQPVGGMVLLLGAMTRADVYAEAFRAVGLDCVIAGGSVFASAPEVRTVQALVRLLANPLDAAGGMVPVLSSDLFALGAQEFLALCTAIDPETGETRRRNVDAGLFSDDDAPGFGELSLLERARTVLRRAIGRVGRDPIHVIARAVVNESGWFVRLARRGTEGRAVAANVLKALEAIEAIEQAAPRAPRAVSLAFDAYLAGKQAPGALNGQDGGAVRIMTVHTSKGLEFPVVAASECFGIKPNTDRMQVAMDDAGHVQVACLTARFAGTVLPDGTAVSAKAVEDRFAKYLGGTGSWLTPELMDDVCSSTSAAGRFLEMREAENRLELEERARLLYVAMTRASEVLLLAMDAPVGRDRARGLKLDAARDLTGAVLERILPQGCAKLDVDRLVFEGSRPGDYELVALADFTCQDASYAADPVAIAQVEEGAADAGAGADGASCPGCAPSNLDTASGTIPDPGDPAGPAPDAFTLVEPAYVPARVLPEPTPARGFYSYSSVAAARGEEGEDRREAALALDEALQAGDEDGPDDRGEPIGGGAGAVRSAAGAAWPTSAGPDGVAVADGDPTALGSAFHAAAQLMVDCGLDEVPASRLRALSRLWGLTEGQRTRLDAALARWRTSAVRAEVLAWPCVRAEVPFCVPGADSLAERYGAFVEGAIDLLATDPADPARALVVDYKTGGSAAETPERLQAKHALQAQIYADALHAVGYTQVSLRFVRVEIEDAARPGEPQVVCYERSDERS